MSEYTSILCWAGEHADNRLCGAGYHCMHLECSPQMVKMSEWPRDPVYLALLKDADSSGSVEGATRPFTAARVWSACRTLSRCMEGLGIPAARIPAHLPELMDYKAEERGFAALTP